MKTLFYQDKEIQLNYSTTLNHLIPYQLYQCGLSLPALGLASYIYTLPKQWRLSVTHLSKQLKMSKNTCRKYLKEIFSNEKAREVFKVKEAEINTYDFEEGLTAYDYASDTQELENFTSSVAKDVSEPNRKKVLLIQTQRQRYLLNLCFKGMDCHASTSVPARNDGGKLSSRADEVGVAIHTKADSKNAQNLNTIKRDSKESLKDSSSKRTRKNFSEFLELKRFSKNEQEAIKLWITYKQESSKTKLKPAQVDFQLRKITRFKEQGQDICAVIEKSLDMGWQGLFPQRDSALLKKPAAAAPCTASLVLRDKAGSLPFACGKATQGLSPHKSRRNPALSSQNKGHRSALADVSLEILESQEIKLKPRMPKNLGGKAVLRVENA